MRKLSRALNFLEQVLQLRSYEWRIIFLNEMTAARSEYDPRGSVSIAEL